MAEPLRVLLLEDNPADVELVRFELEEAGFAFTLKVVMTEQDFVRELQEFHPALILSDYDLPRYNGALALAEAKRRCPDIPFILVTGAVTEDRAIDILTQGAKDYVLKKRLQQRLVPAVRRALVEAEEHRARKEAEAELRQAHRTLEARVKVRTAELEAEMAARKKTEEALQDSEKRYRRLFEASKDGILILDADTGKVVDVNPFLLQLLGYSYDALYGKYIWEIGVFKDIAASKSAFKTLQKNEYIHYDDVPLESLDGRPITVEFISNVYLVDHSKVVQCNIRDITERKRVEEELRRNEHLYRAIGESIDYGIWVCEPDGRNIYASKSFLDLVGLTQEQCSNFGWGDVLHPDDAERTIAAWKSCVRTGCIWDVEHRFRGVDGQWHSVLARGVPVRNEQGEVTCWAGINLDISSLKKAETSLKERTQQLEDANKELESFSYSVSHDLKAPLRTIDGYFRMFSKKYGGALTDDAARMINIIRDSTERMGVLIDDLLSFSRVLRNSMSLSEIDMNGLASEVWNGIRAENQERDLEWKITGLRPGFGDRVLIRQALSNLISNAVKFTRPRKPGIIEMSSYAEPDRVVYQVKDNGVGFDMAFYPKLFGVFQRLHGDEEYEGTGVGLAIVQRIISRHGGRVWAEGKVDEGACFYFTLPKGGN